jgi:uncharacterized protein YbjT (DUF2867 family)
MKSAPCAIQALKAGCWDVGMTYLILGGPGRTGRRIFDGLSASGVPVRSASRRTGFDWDDEATWPSALEGATRAYVCVSPDLAFPGVPEMLERFGDAAARAGVERFVLLSGRGEDGARRSEDALRRSGIVTVVLRCSWFQQNFSENFLLGPAQRGVLRLPARDIPEAFVDLDDVADAAVVALTEPVSTGGTYELSGPELLTFADVAQQLSRVTERAISFEPVDKAAFMVDVAADGIPSEASAPLADLFAEVLDGRNASVTSGVQELLARPAAPFGAYAERTAATGIWA